MTSQLDAETIFFLRNVIESGGEINKASENSTTAAEKYKLNINNNIKERLDDWPYNPVEDPPEAEVAIESKEFLRNTIVDGKFSMEVFSDPVRYSELNSIDPPSEAAIKLIKSSNVEELLKLDGDVGSIVGVASAAVIVGVSIVLLSKASQDEIIQDFGNIDRL